jgi:lipid-binding SYLF domain-containing protein
MFKRTFLLMAAAITVVGFTGCTTTMPEKPAADTSAKRANLNAGADKVLADLYKQVPGSRDLVTKAKGVLVFPNVVTAGLGVGASYGEGVLRKDNQPTSYYNTAGGSIGLIAGAQSKAVFMLFMTSESLAKFEASKGWTAGADASVVVLNLGANAAIDTKTVQEPIVGFVLTNGGLMANASIDGTKITKLDM